MRTAAAEVTSPEGSPSHRSAKVALCSAVGTVFGMASVGRFGAVPLGLAVSRPRKSQTPLIFYGYPVELIQEWCAVSKQTAYLYKIGARKPSRQALRLFTLHREGRILGKEWEGWRIKGGRLFDPEGVPADARQLRAFSLMMQFANELARRDPETRKRYFDILNLAAG
jgi:hypothetical protein